MWFRLSVFRCGGCTDAVDGVHVGLWPGEQVKLEGESGLKLDLVRFDFLGLSQRSEVKEISRETLNEYGCGSCGPRGFYGSVLPHIEIENAVAKFMGTEGAIGYSDEASTVTSTIPAFAKRGDLIIADSGIHEAVRIGMELSRAKIIYYEHCNTNDLEAKLQGVLEEDKRLRRNSTKQRRFIVTEGVFRNSGHIAPLDAIVELKERFRFRLVVDESFSFGTLGKTGRGLTETFGIDITRVDIVMVGLAFSLASVGGLCIGNIEVVDHQRLSGAGYCFSASAPPFVSRAAVRALSIVENEPKLVERLHSVTNTLVAEINKIDGLTVTSHAQSPIIHVGLSGAKAADRCALSSHVCLAGLGQWFPYG